MGSGGTVPASQEGPEAADRFHRFEARPGLNRGERYPRSARITSGRELEEVVRRGKKWRRAHLDLFWLQADEGVPRMGLIVPKYRHNAPERNLLRRRLREIWRRELALRLPPGRLILRVRRDSYQASFADLQKDLLAWCRGAGG